jgi:hypothetical protein
MEEVKNTIPEAETIDTEIVNLSEEDIEAIAAEVQTTFNAEPIEVLVEEGEVENVQDAN